MRFMLNDARLAFPNLFEARSMPGGGPAAFGCSLLIPQDHPQLKDLEKAIEATAREEWGVKADTILKGLRAQDRTCLHNGDAKEQYGGFAGNFYVSARSKIKPLVVDQQRHEVSAESGVVYGGCFGNASLELWAQDSPQYGKRINAQIRGFQKTRDGDAFGGGTRATTDEFGDVSDTGDVDPTA